MGLINWHDMYQVLYVNINNLHVHSCVLKVLTWFCAAEYKRRHFSGLLSFKHLWAIEQVPSIKIVSLTLMSSRSYRCLMLLWIIFCAICMKDRSI
jgi:hypothetical protein